MSSKEKSCEFSEWRGEGGWSPISRSKVEQRTGLGSAGSH